PPRDLDVTSAGLEPFAGGAVGEPDALLKLLNGLRLDVAINDRAVGLGDTIARVRELVGQVAVIGEQEQPLGVGIEPADGVYAGREIAREKVDRTDLFALRDIGAVDTLRLVHQEVEPL